MVKYFERKWMIHNQNLMRIYSMVKAACEVYGRGTLRGSTLLVRDSAWKAFTQKTRAWLNFLGFAR